MCGSPGWVVWQQDQNPISWPPALGTEPSFLLLEVLSSVSASSNSAAGMLPDGPWQSPDPSSHFVDSHVGAGVVTSLGQMSQRSAPWEPPGERVDSSHPYGVLLSD